MALSAAVPVIRLSPEERKQDGMDTRSAARISFSESPTNKIQNKICGPL